MPDFLHGVEVVEVDDDFRTIQKLQAPLLASLALTRVRTARHARQINRSSWSAINGKSLRN